MAADDNSIGKANKNMQMENDSAVKYHYYTKLRDIYESHLNYDRNFKKPLRLERISQIMIALIWLSVIITAVVLYMRQAYSRFSRYGVKHFKIVPPVGNLMNELMQKKHLAESLNDMYQSFPEERFVGRYEFMKRVVMIRDLELVKKIAIKDFEHFLDHRMLVDDSVEPLFGRNLFSLRGQEWKDMRSTLSPAFTSSKMRAMVTFMMDKFNVKVFSEATTNFFQSIVMSTMAERQKKNIFRPDMIHLLMEAKKVI